MSTPPVDLFHAYVYGSAVWYTIRGLARTFWPSTVFRWFEAHPLREPTKLELYNIRTDALGLLLLAFMLIALSGVANPLAPPVARSSSPPLPKTAGPPVAAAWRRAARAAVAGTIFHHLGTAALAYQQWADPGTSTGAMLLGWAFSSGIALLGAAAFVEAGSGGAPAAEGQQRAKRKSVSVVVDGHVESPKARVRSPRATKA